MRYFALMCTAVALSAAPSAAWGQVYGDPNSLVDYWYRTYLGRPAEPAGLSIWATQLSQGSSPDTVLATILGSDEFYNRAGATPQGFITLLYNDILRRPPNAGELEFWVRKMYLEPRATIADEILTQNPGVWVGSAGVYTAPATPPAVVVPGIELRRYREWERDRRPDWNHHREIYDYRRPETHVHRDEHHDKHR
jgi:hypothetical protein